MYMYAINWIQNRIGRMQLGLEGPCEFYMCILSKGDQFCFEVNCLTSEYQRVKHTHLLWKMHVYFNMHQSFHYAI